MAQIGAGPQLPTQAPLAPLEIAAGRAGVQQKYGRADAAMKEFDVAEGVQDLSNKIKGTQAESQIHKIVSALQYGGMAAVASVIGPEEAKNLKPLAAGNGFIEEDDDGSKTLVTVGPKGVSIKYIAAPKKAGAGVTWSKPYTVDMDGKKVRLQRSSTGQERQVSAGSSAASEGNFDAEGNLTLNNGQVYTKAQLRTLGETYYKTGKVASVGRKNSALRSAIVQNGIEVAMENEQSGYSVAGSWAETKAQGSSLSKQKANVDFATAFIDNIDKQIGKANTRLKEIQKNFPRLANIPIRLWDEKVTGVAQRNMVRMWIKEISSETARLSQGNPQSIAEMSASAVESWDKIHDLDLPLKELIDLLGETKISGRLRQTSLQDQYNRTLKEVGSAPTSFAERAPIAKGSMYQGKKVLRVGRDGDKQFVLLEGEIDPVEVK
jgi:hypothetical protein